MSTFPSLDDFVRRTGLSQSVVSKLAEADAFSSLAIDRRAALWQALGQECKARHMPLLNGSTGFGARPPSTRTNSGDSCFRIRDF